MYPLSTKDIREWLIDNSYEYQRLKAEEYPSFDNNLLFLYPQLYELMEYYALRHKCDEALNNLKDIIYKDFNEFVIWTKRNEILGSEKLLMFEVNYFNWGDEAKNGSFKINNGLYTERKPFESILCFCKIFQILYWNNSLHNEQITDKKFSAIRQEVLSILTNLYVFRELYD